MKFGNWLGLLGLAASLVLLWTLREAVILLFAAVVLAMALCTLVGTVRQRLGWPRAAALVLSLASVLLLVLVALTVILPPFVSQFSQLIQKLPEAADRLAQLLHDTLRGASQMLYGRNSSGLNWLGQSLQAGLQAPGGGIAGGLGGGLGGGLQRLLGLAGNLGAGLLQTLFVVAVALMVASQPQSYREVAILLVPSFYRRRFRQVLLLCGQALSGWMVGVLISSLCVGTMAAIGLSLLGVKLVAANALLAGLLNVIPNIGPTLSTIFPMSVALLEDPWKALAVLGLYIVVQNLESYVITPSVMHHQVRLLPGLTLFTQLVAALVFGPLGQIGRASCRERV